MRTLPPVIVIAGAAMRTPLAMTTEPAWSIVTGWCELIECVTTSGSSAFAAGAANTSMSKAPTTGQSPFTFRP